MNIKSLPRAIQGWRRTLLYVVLVLSVLFGAFYAYAAVALVLEYGNDGVSSAIFAAIIAIVSWGVSAFSVVMLNKKAANRSGV